ncbi:unnamed protein product [Penicillium viridicatum]
MSTFLIRCAGTTSGAFRTTSYSHTSLPEINQAPYSIDHVPQWNGVPVLLELEKQVEDLLKDSRDETNTEGDSPLNAVIIPLGGGGLLAGTATYFSSKPSTYVFGAEPSFEGGDDGRRGLACGSRISIVSAMTIADGLRTPVGEVNWAIISDVKKVRGVFSVTEEHIKEAMVLILERLKVFIEQSAAVLLAVILFDEEFRQIAEKKAERRDGMLVWFCQEVILR